MTKRPKGRDVLPGAKTQAMAGFDYSIEAQLFPTRNRKSRRPSFAYKRFEHAVDAIRFAMEELPPDALLGACLEVDEERYDKMLRGITHAVRMTLDPKGRNGVLDKSYGSLTSSGCPTNRRRC